MDSTNLSSLIGESLEQEQVEQQSQPKQQDGQKKPLPPAFTSVPDRAPTQSSLQKYSPLDWSGYFDEEQNVSIPDSTDVSVENVDDIPEQKDLLFFVFMVEVILASKIKEKARVVAMDMRGHGKSSTENDLDLSIETMYKDVFAVVKEMYGDSPPAIVLVGHRYEGLSEKFLSSPVPKLLLLAGTDRLDRYRDSVGHCSRNLNFDMKEYLE